MTVKESSAAALVRFTGLGIVCFNDEARRGEIAAIRDDKHLLSIRIQQAVYQDGVEDDIVVYEDIATYQNLPKDDVQIEIKAAREPAIEGYEIYRGGDFDRLSSTDLNDFRWVVHMDTLHGGAPLTPTADGRHPLTKIYIGNGLFYTHKLDTNLFFEKVEADAAGGAAGRREVFGNVAETVGVKIEAAEVSFSIRIGGREETRTLKRGGLPFRIEFKNMDYSPDAVYSDMADYYGYLSCPAGNRFDLAPLIEDGDGEPAGGGAINQKRFCHPVASDLPSIDQL